MARAVEVVLREERGVPSTWREHVSALTKWES